MYTNPTIDSHFTNSGYWSKPGPNMPLNLYTAQYLQLVELKQDSNIYHAILKNFYDNIDTETMKKWHRQHI